MRSFSKGVSAKAVAAANKVEVKHGKSNKNTQY